MLTTNLFDVNIIKHLITFVIELHLNLKHFSAPGGLFYHCLQTLAFVFVFCGANVHQTYHKCQVFYDELQQIKK